MDLQLKKLAHFSGRPGPLLLVIMDGVGIGKQHPDIGEIANGQRSSSH